MDSCPCISLESHVYRELGWPAWAGARPGTAAAPAQQLRRPHGRRVGLDGGEPQGGGRPERRAGRDAWAKPDGGGGGRGQCQRAVRIGLAGPAGQWRAAAPAFHQGAAAQPGLRRARCAGGVRGSACRTRMQSAGPRCPNNSCAPDGVRVLPCCRRHSRWPCPSSPSC